MTKHLIVCPPDQSDTVAEALKDFDPKQIWPGAFLLENATAKALGDQLGALPEGMRVIATELHTTQTIVLTGMSQPEAGLLGAGMIADILGQS